MNKKFSFLFIGLLVLGVGIVQGAGLGDAVDAPSLTWVTGGSAEWFAQGSTWYSLNEAAQSGTIGNSQSSYLRTNVTGPGTLKFWWKVSSEYDADFLRFSIDGTTQNRISGTVNWSQRSYSISSGTHTLEWRYTKNSANSRGSDCGWVDKVEFIPPGLTVVSPNGGENWQQGTNHIITWQYSGNPGSYLKIELLNGTTTNLLISSSTSIGSGGSGSRSWTVPSDQPLGSDYKIRITSTSNSIFTDTSDMDFTISAAPPTLLEIIADLQASVSALWTNATEQQSVIQAEADARIAGDLELQTNASEQQTAIAAIPATHFGEWNRTFVANTLYQAQTDGFVFAETIVDPSDQNNWIAVEIRTSANATLFPSINIYDNANASVHDDWAEAIFPIREGDYWIVYGWDGSIDEAHEYVKVYWLPLET